MFFDYGLLTPIDNKAIELFSIVRNDVANYLKEHHIDEGYNGSSCINKGALIRLLAVMYGLNVYRSVKDGYITSDVELNTILSYDVIKCLFTNCKFNIQPIMDVAYNLPAAVITEDISSLYENSGIVTCFTNTTPNEDEAIYEPLDCPV